MTRRRMVFGLVAVLCTTLAWSCGGRREERAATERPPVILISIDTLRADHLPMFGYTGVETPNLDALRRDGILFTAAWSHAPLTLPSHASILTGLLPQHHHVRNNIGYTLDAKIPTVASMLHDAGYATGAAVSAYVLRRATGMNNGFDSWDDSVPVTAGAAYGSLQRPGAVTIEASREWIASHDAMPFFFFVHLFEPHSPYEPAEAFRARYASSPYDGEIATADALVGELIADLKARGIYDRALILFLSDHGEGLSQHGELEHGVFLYRETTRVPLLVKLPGGARAGETSNEPVGLVDVLPTIAAITGATPPATIDGVSLLGPKRADRTIYAETLYPRIHLGASELRALAGSRFHFIQAPRSELYDMTADPAETRNVLAEQRRTYVAMRNALDAYGAAITLPSRLDPEESRKLAALGYLGSSQGASSGPLPDPKDRIGELADYAKANAAIRDGDAPRGIAMLRKVVERNPQFSDAWNRLATTLEKEGRPAEAAEAYSSAMRHIPEVATDFALPLGTILLRLGKLAEAAEHARLAESRSPGRAHLLLALVALARRDIRSAETEVTIAKRDPEAFVDASVLLAGIVSQQGRPNDALALLDAAEQYTRDTHAGPAKSLDSVRADALMRLGRPRDAVTALRRAISLFPSDRAAYAELAAIYASGGRQTEAQGVLEELVRANPDPASRRFAEQVRTQLRLASR